MCLPLKTIMLPAFYPGVCHSVITLDGVVKFYDLQPNTASGLDVIPNRVVRNTSDGD